MKNLLCKQLIKQLNNQSGFLVLNVLVSGFASLLLLGTGALALHRLEHSKSLHDCRTTAFQAQVDFAKALSRLFRLNPKAKKLEMESRHLKAQLAANPDPATKSLLAGRLAVVVTEQLFLKSQQLAILSESRLRAEAQVGQWRTRQPATAKASVANLAVLPAMASLAPPYKTKADFEKEQALEFHVIRQGTEWIRCGATIKELGVGWEVRLNAAK